MGVTALAAVVVLDVIVADFPFSFAVFVFGGEVALIFWLLIRGRKIRVPTINLPVLSDKAP
jgi:hypothetical protein